MKQDILKWIVRVTFVLLACATLGAAAGTKPGPLSTQDIGVEEEYAPRWKGNKMNAITLGSKQHGSREFKCAASGNPEPSLTWLKDGKPFPGPNLDVPERVQYKRKSLVLNELRLTDEGKYSCIASNYLGSIQWNYTLYVSSSPIGEVVPIIQALPNVTATEGDNVTIKCFFMSPTTANVQWLKHIKINGSYTTTEGLLNFETVQTTNPLDDSKAEVLVLQSVQQEDTAPYTCLVVNKYGQNFKTTYLEVRPRPVVAALTDDNDRPKMIIIAIVVSCIAFLAVIVAIFIYCKIRKDRRDQIRINNMRRKDEMNPIYPLISEDDFQIPYDDVFEFPRGNLELGETLGEGAFGVVMKGFAIGLAGKMEPVIVAIKMLKCDATSRELRMLVEEMQTMKSLKSHKNIINFLGCCSQDGPLFVLVEYAAHGNLRDFLKQQRPPESSGGYERPRPYIEERAIKPLTNKDLLSFSLQIARGMSYLAAMKIIHRDLAARNILVSEDYVLKIADFGLTKELAEREYYRKITDGRLPIKWMAPESLNERKFTTKSDVWSFGVLLWEIFTFGSNPYPSVPIESLYQLLKEGTRMEKPRYSTVEMYSIMLRSWKDNPRDRPSFSDLEVMIDSMLTLAADQDYLNLEPTQDEVMDDEVFDPAVTQMHARRSDSQYSSMSSEHSHSMTPPSGKNRQHIRHHRLAPNREASDEDESSDEGLRGASRAALFTRKLSSGSEGISAGMTATSSEAASGDDRYDPDIVSHGSSGRGEDGSVFDSEEEDIALHHCTVVVEPNVGSASHSHGNHLRQSLLVHPAQLDVHYVSPRKGMTSHMTSPCPSSGRRGFQSSCDSMQIYATGDEEDSVFINQSPGQTDYNVVSSDKVECVECNV